ncbi:MAG: hypothetical protein ACI89T_000860 [Cognaticolwellia sp.]|jgi:hypothetical protein
MITSKVLREVRKITDDLAKLKLMSLYFRSAHRAANNSMLFRPVSGLNFVINKVLPLRGQRQTYAYSKVNNFPIIS